MSQTVAIMAALRIARQSNVNNITGQAAGEAPSHYQRITQPASDENDLKPANQLPFSSGDGHDDDHEQRYPHFFAWLHGNKNTHSNRTQPQTQQKPTVRSSSVHSSCCQHSSSNNTSNSSRPTSAASYNSSSRPGSAASNRLFSATKEHTQASRMSSLSTVPERGITNSPGRPSSRSAGLMQHQRQQALHERPCSASLLQQRQPGVFQRQMTAGSGSSSRSSRPQSASLTSRVSVARPGQPHPAGCQADSKQQHCRHSSAVAMSPWVQQVQQAQQAIQLAGCVPAEAQATDSASGGLQSSSVSAEANNASGAVENSSSSSSNPWAAFGHDAPAAWQQLGTPALPTGSNQEGHRDWSMQLTGSMACSLAVRPDSPQSPTAAAHRSACDTPDSRSSQQQQLQQTCPHAARQLFLQLPLRSHHAPMSRQNLQLLAMGLQWALLEVGAPLSVHLPDYASGDQQQLACWSAHDQVAAELQVYSTLLAELCRQSHAECTQKGTLLLAAVTRYQQLLHEALTACNMQHNSLQEAAAAAQQQEDSIQELVLQVERMQQQNQQLTESLTAKQQELEAVRTDLKQHQDKLRKGRYHLITEQVQEARVELQKRMVEQWGVQLQAARSDWETEAGASREKWQAAMLQLLAETAGQDVADGLQQQLASLDTVLGSTASSLQNDSKLASDEA